MKIECETIVNWNKEEPFAVVYTRDKEVMKKLDQMCSRYTRDAVLVLYIWYNGKKNAS